MNKPPVSFLFDMFHLISLILIYVCLLVMREIIQPDMKKKTFKNSITNSENNLISCVKQTE